MFNISRFYITVYTTAFLSIPCIAQSWDWVFSGNGSGGITVQANYTGLYVLSYGCSIPYGNYSLSCGYGGDMIAKHDLQGNVIWVKQMIGVQSADMSVDRAGNSYIVGSCSSATFCGVNNTLTVTNPGDMNAFIVKYDVTGEVLWVKTWGVPNSSDGANKIKTNPYGESYVAGTYYKSLYQGGPATNFFITKFDMQGNDLWNQSSNWKGSFVAGGIDLDEQNNIYVSGTFLDSAVFSNATLYTNTYCSIAIVKYDKMGNLIWAKKTGTSYDAANELALDNKGHFYLTGSFSGQSNFGNVTLNAPQQLGSCIFIAKFDTSANCLWAKSSQKRSGVSVATDTAGNCFMSGRMIGSASFGTGTNSANFNGPKGDQFFIIKYNPSGNIIWAVAPGGDQHGGNSASDICTDISGNCYVTGGCDAVTSFGNYTLNQRSFYITRLSTQFFISPANNGTVAVGINEAQNLQNSFSVYPNPSTGQVFVSLLNSNGLKNISLQVKNVIGQSIFEKSYDVNANEFVQEISLGHLPRGIYFVQVSADKAREIRKIILE
jgi:hypothetical protein